MSTPRTVPALLLGLALAAVTAAAAPPVSQPIPETRDEIPWQDLFSVRVLATPSVAPGQELRFRAQVYSPYDLRPERGVEMAATLEPEVLQKGGDRQVVERRLETTGRTDATGEWAGTFTIPDDTVRASSGSLRVRARAGGQERKASTWVDMLGPRVYLSTDRTLYRPGEHLRARALWAGQASLPAGTPVRFELVDARGRRVLDDRSETSVHGIAHTEWRIPETLSPGTYRLRAESPGMEHGESRRLRIAPFERSPSGFRGTPRSSSSTRPGSSSTPPNRPG